jgi:Rieske Fe-S protein
MPDDPPDPDPGRRRFLKIATCGLGGGLGLAVAAPAVGYLLHPAGKKIVTSSAEPIDIGPLARLPEGVLTRINVVAPAVRDAWTAASNVPLGAAWLRRAGDQVTALSGICPHLGCAIALDQTAMRFTCPCHDSAFAATGERIAGPARRGLDPLPVSVENGRLRLTWIKFKTDISAREPA